MNPQKIDDFKRKIEKETIDNIIDKITVTDSFFYAEMVVVKVPFTENPFSDEVEAIIKMRLFNSKEFQQPNQINDKPLKSLRAKEIETRVRINRERLSSKEDTMMIIYEEVSKQLAADLFQANAANIHQVSFFKKDNKTYI